MTAYRAGTWASGEEGHAWGGLTAYRAGIWAPGEEGHA